jgi:hypothetical protein
VGSWSTGIFDSKIDHTQRLAALSNYLLIGIQRSLVWCGPSVTILLARCWNLFFTATSLKVEGWVSCDPNKQQNKQCDSHSIGKFILGRIVLNTINCFRFLPLEPARVRSIVTRNVAEKSGWDKAFVFLDAFHTCERNIVEGERWLVRYGYVTCRRTLRPHPSITASQIQAGFQQVCVLFIVFFSIPSDLTSSLRWLVHFCCFWSQFYMLNYN